MSVIIRGAYPSVCRTSANSKVGDGMGYSTAGTGASSLAGTSVSGEIVSSTGVFVVALSVLLIFLHTGFSAEVRLNLMCFLSHDDAFSVEAEGTSVTDSVGGH